jgi:hypothetical protein
MALSKRKPVKVYQDPRISVNPLCEYVDDASATRRTSIIKQCKRPVSYITKWYNDAEDILSFYLSKVRNDSKVLSVETQRLKAIAKTHPDEMERKFALASATALNSFLAHELDIRTLLSPYHLDIAVNDSKHKFMLCGVQISLRPELILRDQEGKQQLGFVKFYFGKNEALTESRAELIACLTKYYFEQEFAFAFKPQHCLVLDVFTGRLWQAPKAHKRNLSNIEASLREIADRWHIV